MAVFDANLIVAIVVNAPISAHARSHLDHDNWPIAPTFLMIELASALWQNTKAGVITPARATRALQEVPATLDLQTDAPLVEPAYRIAVAANHSVYDCIYLALAEREGVALITADRRLAALARQRGIEAILIGG